MIATGNRSLTMNFFVGAQHAAPLLDNTHLILEPVGVRVPAAYPPWQAVCRGALQRVPHRSRTL